VKASVSRFLEQKLKLRVNQGKSAVARPGERKFLGFSFTFGNKPKRWIAPQSLERFKLKVRALTRAGRNPDLAHLVQLNLSLVKAKLADEKK
jgi:RNA-directed DNA polymerase